MKRVEPNGGEFGFEKCRGLLEGAPFISDNLCEGCAEHFRQLLSLLESLGVPFVHDKRLVRGLDYYTKTTFEVVSEVGARVVSLRDVRRDREWLVQGEPPSELEQMAWATEDATFSGRESFGWDECLPTTSACRDPLATDGRDLRDHGDQWGRGA